MTSRTTGLPTLGLLAASPLPTALTPLLVAVRRWCQVLVMTHDVHIEVDAVLSWGPEADVRKDRPLALWADTQEDLDRPGFAAADVIVSDREVVVDAAGRRGLLAPGPEPAPAGVPIPPFVRRRLRSARGLPPNMVVEYGDGTWYPANGAVRPDRELSTTALACASAAIALGAAVLAAMAWATPCVTDEATAIQIGALPERDLLIGATADHRYQLGLELATNAVVAAKLSWAGRTLVEQRHSPQLAGARLVRRLGLSGATSLPNEQLLGAQLAELGTPADAVITERVAAATAGFTLGEG